MKLRVIKVSEMIFNYALKKHIPKLSKDVVLNVKRKMSVFLKKK